MKVKNFNKNHIIASSVQGKPLTRVEMQQEIAEAEKEYKNGDFTTQEQLKEEIKDWKK